jgi:hypothetical protein
MVDALIGPYSSAHIKATKALSGKPFLKPAFPSMQGQQRHFTRSSGWARDVEAITKDDDYPRARRMGLK